MPQDPPSNRKPIQIDQADCYDYPQYWDLAFQSETEPEADFFEKACRKYVDGPVKRVFEPGCGGGRLILELVRRGYQLEAIDLSESSVNHANRRLKRAKLQADIRVGDMTRFATSQPMDAVINTMNTFRHLASEAAARAHLESVHQCLRPGGLFILGFHLHPPDTDPEDGEWWVEKRGKTSVRTTLRVRETNLTQRYEVVRFNLRVRTPTKDLKIRTDYQLRIYDAAQIRSTLQSVPGLELVDVYDFMYDIDEPLELDDQLGDAVFVLRKRDVS